MAIALRTIQQSLSGGGFTAKEQQTLYDVRPVKLQNFLSGVSQNVNASTAFVDPTVASAAGFILGNCLMIELGETTNVSYSNIWRIRAFGKATTSAAAGLQLQLTTYDGLQVQTAASNGVNWVAYTAAGVAAGTTAVNAPFTSGAVNVVSWEMDALVEIAAYGRIGIQFTQAVSTAVNTTIGNGAAYIEAEAILA